MATFSSDSDAVAAAVAVQQGRLTAQRSDARTPAVRVGLSTGEASAEGGDWFGPPVIEAARFCAEAGGGQILSTGVVAPSSAAAATIASRPRAPHAQGLRRAGGGERRRVGAVARRSCCRRPPSQRWRRRRRSSGRNAELDTVLQAWKDATAGKHAVALVAGEPGVGKTRLLAELAQRARADGATVLWGRCDEDPLLPYQPFVEQVRHWLASDPSAALPARPRAPPARDETASSTTIDATIDGEAERLRLFEAAAALYRRSPTTARCSSCSTTCTGRPRRRC